MKKYYVTKMPKLMAIMKFMMKTVLTYFQIIKIEGLFHVRLRKWGNPSLVFTLSIKRYNQLKIKLQLLLNTLSFYGFP